MGTWIKETEQALYLMEGGYYISKISKYPSKGNSTEKVLNITGLKAWFARADAPRGMTVSKEGPEPLPLPALAKPASDEAGPKRINANGLRLIKSFEGLRLDAYQDAVGIWTIGYGTTRSVKAGMKITHEQAEEFLKDDLARFEKAIHEAVKHPVNDNQFSALISFTYNVGAGALRSSTLLKKLNRGDVRGAADEFLRWNKAGKRVLAGLTRRRQAERALFLGEDFGKLL
ncbi:MAG: lysozyme [Leptolyngbya sp. SIO4C1]|nr:lysozyme [Leptolyngbya sp. SIO4C1]